MTYALETGTRRCDTDSSVRTHPEGEMRGKQRGLVPVNREIINMSKLMEHDQVQE